MEAEDEDASERTTRVVTALLILSPFLCAFCYVLVLAQGASGQASDWPRRVRDVPWRRGSQMVAGRESDARSLVDRTDLESVRTLSGVVLCSLSFHRHRDHTDHDSDRAVAAGTDAADRCFAAAGFENGLAVDFRASGKTPHGRAGSVAVHWLEGTP